MKLRTIADVVASLPVVRMGSLSAPAYAGPADDSRTRVGLAVESMKRHTTDEGWQLFAALEHAGYTLHGLDIGPSLTDVREILKRESPAVVVVQDPREYDGLTADRSRDPRMRFRHVDALRGHDGFVLSIIKDAQHAPQYHAGALANMGAHAVVCYYNPRIVCHLAPYLRPQHLVRTWHTVDPALVPAYSAGGRKGALLSGAISGAYPLRTKLAQRVGSLPEVTYLKHPGYGRSGCRTPDYLRTLSRFKVAICTSSMYGYALRKVAEATAAGCIVLSDLPVDEVMPAIDDNVVRIPSQIRTSHVAGLLRELYTTYDPARQQHFAELACQWYDYRAEGSRLAEVIEAMRASYNGGA